jgi:transcription antitermination protein NusB
MSAQPGTRAARRRAARLAAMQALYQAEMTGTDPETVIAEFRAHRLGREIDGEDYGDADPAMFAELVRGVASKREEIDPMIAGSLSRDWSLERIERLARIGLELGVYELMAKADVPIAVVIDEYVDLTHAFFAGAEPRFVHGVLDRLGKRLRGAPGERPPGG